MQMLQLIGAQRIRNDAIGYAKYDVIFYELVYFIKQNWVIYFTFLLMKHIKNMLSKNIQWKRNIVGF